MYPKEIEAIEAHHEIIKNMCFLTARFSGLAEDISDDMNFEDMRDEVHGLVTFAKNSIEIASNDFLEKCAHLCGVSMDDYM